jgi:hypothetical protein
LEPSTVPHPPYIDLDALRPIQACQHRRMSKPRGWPPRINGMPRLDHLDSSNTLNALLSTFFGGRSALPVGAQGLLTNLTRLTDKAILEYESAGRAWIAI